MTSIYMDYMKQLNSRRSRNSRTGRRPSRRAPVHRAVMLGVALAAGVVACKDSNVPFFTAPTSVPNSPAGIQNGITGIFAAQRIDMVFFVTNLVAGYARDGAVFTNTEARTVEYPLGVFPTPSSSGNVWAQEYQNITQAHQVLATLSNVSPAYLPDSAKALTGLLQTLIAYNYMLIAEAHDTLGLAVQGATISQTPPPAVCNKDGWAYIAALLDTANGNLNAAGAIPIPIRMPKGFSALAQAGPSTTAGTFASFNRALAGKAKLELAYAIARTAGGPAPTPTTAGTPDAPSLAGALAALDSSAMYNPAVLAPDPSGGFTPSQYVITHDFSATSGDIVNPINGEIGTLAQLNDFVVSVDTLHDLRWAAKFGKNPNAVQQQLYNPVASKYIPIMYPSPSASIPIVREVQLVLWHAQILMGMGPAHYAAALADINAVRTTVGGPALVPYPAGDAASYVTLRNDLLQEQRISTVWEASADRTIALRMYGLAAVADTTWNGKEDPLVGQGKDIDVHTTVYPIPLTELNARGGSFVTSCN
jgi:hypothetical protein